MTTHSSKSKKRKEILSGIRVLEFGGLAPSPYCGMILADFGADVVRLDQEGKEELANSLGRGKRSIVLNLKQPHCIQLVKKIISHFDVLIDPYRPGVMERIGLGPNELMSLHPQLIYARLTGWGQSGAYAHQAGHDINYLAISGALSNFVRFNEKPLAPVNYLADFAGGGLFCALGIVLALFERVSSKIGQVIDSAMIDGVNHMSAFLHNLHAIGFWNDLPGTNFLDSGAPFYDTYECSDKQYVAVGAIEPQFYQQLVEGLELTTHDLAQLHNQMNLEKWPQLRELFEKQFRTHTQQYWVRKFYGKDACVSPVLALKEVQLDPHMQQRNALHYSTRNNLANTTSNNLTNDLTNDVPIVHVAATPRFSRTPGNNVGIIPEIGQHTEEVLRECGISQNEIIMTLFQEKSKL